MPPEGSAAILLFSVVLLTTIYLAFILAEYDDGE